MLVKVSGAAVQGLEAIPITIEVNASKGFRFTLVGLPDNAVKESHERIVAAFENCGQKFPAARITVNMAPADIKKEGTGYDLPLAIGILASQNKISNIAKLEKYMLVGELSLDGSLQPIRGALPIAIKARELEYDGLIVPEQNVREAAVVNKLKVYGMQNIKEVIDFFNETQAFNPYFVDTRNEFYQQQLKTDCDFADVKGQAHAKRALEVAAAGGHNVILIGPPGSGKSMMARRIPSILPPLTLSESLETTQIHSVAGKLDRETSLITQRPFRSPHHSISRAALTGGGSNPMPGEISLAHNGVLFCDELPEFNRQTLEMLRQPLEDRKINLSRSRNSITYPCSFMFVASMNPCPCGYYNDPTHDCICTPGQIQRYLGKISGPLMDRIDLQVEIAPLSFEELSQNRKEESSSEIRKRVVRAREIQAKRFSTYPGIHCNAQMNSKLLHLYAEPQGACIELLRTAMNKFQLSARAYDRILRVARTIADLDESDSICTEHIAEAIGYRNLDRNSWGQ